MADFTLPYLVSFKIAWLWNNLWKYFNTSVLQQTVMSVSPDGAFVLLKRASVLFKRASVLLKRASVLLKWASVLLKWASATRIRILHQSVFITHLCMITQDIHKHSAHNRQPESQMRSPVFGEMLWAGLPSGTTI